MSGPLKIWFCQFAQSAPLFVSRSAIAPKMKVRSRAIERFQRAICPALSNRSIWVPKNAEFYAHFKSESEIEKKCTDEKLFQKLIKKAVFWESSILAISLLGRTLFWVTTPFKTYSHLWRSGGWGRGGILKVLADKLCHSCSITLLPTSLVPLSYGCFLHGQDASQSTYLYRGEQGKFADALAPTLLLRGNCREIKNPPPLLRPYFWTYPR